jgi:hypothetical protein
MKDRLDGETSGFFIAAIATAPPTWTIAFNFGAYNTVFYGHLFTIWAASIAMFMAGLVLSTKKDAEMPFGWSAAILLILPSIWMVFDVLAIGSSSGLVTAISVILMISVVFLSVPFIVYFLVMAVVPGVEQISSKKLQLGLVAIILVIGLSGYTAGWNNFLLMTCEDFNVAGDTEPANCWREQN